MSQNLSSAAVVIGALRVKYMKGEMRFPTKWHFDKCVGLDEPMQPPFKLRNSK